MSVKPAGLMWQQRFQRSATSAAGLSLQAQIRELLVSLILDGLLPPDQPVPSSRELATQLGVARNTVVIAYQQLVDEGYLIARERRGYFPNPDIPASRLQTEAVPMPTPVVDTGPDWERRFRFRPSQQRNIEKPADWQRYPWPFLYGQFDPKLFPVADWRECCMKTFNALEVGHWAQDRFAPDDETLLQQIRARVLPRRGVWASDDEIMITVGAQQALYLLADLLMSGDSRVGVEDPGYPDARNIFSSRGVRLEALAIDEDGLVVDEQLAGCDYVYVTPSHQCPTTVTMSMARREALLAQAEREDIILIEDDYDAESPFEGEAMPALKSLDRHNRVIYVGSLSKSLAPGLRIGYIVGPAALVAELRSIRRLNLRHPTSFMQRAFARFLSLGHHDALLRRLAVAHQERAQALSVALARHLPSLRHRPLHGGSACWVEGPPWLDAAELARLAQDEGVLIETGAVFFNAQSPPQNCFRMGFSSIAAEHIDDGVRKLGEVFARLCDAHSSI